MHEVGDGVVDYGIVDAPLHKTLGFDCYEVTCSGVQTTETHIGLFLTIEGVDPLEGSVVSLVDVYCISASRLM